MGNEISLPEARQVMGKWCFIMTAKKQPIKPYLIMINMILFIDHTGKNNASHILDKNIKGAEVYMYIYHRTLVTPLMISMYIKHISL